MYFFTYGTLKKGFYNHGMIKHLEFIDKAITCKRFQMYPCVNFAFPFVVKSESNQQISGEVYRINEADLKLLDELEDHPILYKREKTMVRLTNGQSVEAIIYIKNEQNHPEYIDKNHPIFEWTKQIASSEIDEKIDLSGLEKLLTKINEPPTITTDVNGYDIDIKKD